MNRIAVSALALFAIASNSLAQVDDRLFNGMKWRSIGPYRGGRSCAVSGVVGRPNEFYGGFTGGGVWKSTDAGVNWNCVSDGSFKTGSVGAIAVSESHPDVVYAGMGETEIRGNISPGDGVYKSTDAGKTWTHVGLASTQFISRVRIHPKNPDTVWVAALGHVYGPHQDRGIYKSTDGGKSWRKTLFVDDRSGAVDLTFDANDPQTLYAATWTAWRTPHSLNSGGPGSKIFKSSDAGETWREVTRNPGLPSGMLGKIGLSVSRSQPNRIYAMIESADGGLYRSEDAGATWKLINGGADMRQRPWYYTRVYADPKSADTVHVLNVASHKSTNGGQSFSSSAARHSDHHDLWIDPNDPLRMISGNDGGVTVSVDGGRTWTDQDIPTAQFYHVSTDNAFPYRVLGAQQDNSTVRIPSRTRGAGIVRTDWTSTAGGESGYVAAKPDNPNIVLGGSYGGYLTVTNHDSNLSRDISPWPDNPMGGGADVLVHRFQWTFPIIFSHHDPNLVYVCSQHVLASRDLGGSWKAISPDLTRNDKSTQASSGGPITKDNTSVEYYGTVFTLAESPRRRGVLWAGSDDGLLHVTQNGGRSWTDVTPPGIAKWSLFSMIEASPHNPAKAIVAIDNHELDDHSPHIYVTEDVGKSWQRRTSGLPDSAFVRVVREDPVRSGLLYCGTEFGMFVSFNDGNRWQPLQMNLPIVPIHDLAIKDDDLIAATHGRSFWILDDLTPLRGARSGMGNEAVLYPIRPQHGVQFGSATSRTEAAGENPLSGGMAVHYFLPRDASSVRIEMLDKSGVQVATSAGRTAAGHNHVRMTPRYPGFRGFTGMRFWAAGSSPIDAPPGEYTVKLTVDGKVMESKARWLKDPRTPASDKDLIEKFQFSLKVRDDVNLANDAVVAIRATRAHIEEQGKDNPAILEAAKPLFAQILAIEEAIYQTKARSGQDLLNYPIRINNKLAALLGVVQDGEHRPTKQSYDVFKLLNRDLQAQLKALVAVEGRELKAVNEALAKAGKPAAPSLLARREERPTSAP